MILPALSLSLSGVEISMPSLAWQHGVLLGAAGLLGYLLAWITRGFKLRALRKAASWVALEHTTALNAQASEAQTQIFDNQRRLDNALTDRAVLEQRFHLHREASQRHEKEAQDLVAALDAEVANMHELVAQLEPAKTRLAEMELAHAIMNERLISQREVDQRREAEALSRTAGLEADLAATREISAQLAPAKARISDLEAVLASERGRKDALEQMVTITTQRAEDLEARLRAAQQQFEDRETQARQRQADLIRDLAERQEANIADRARFEKTEKELAQLQQTYESYRQQAETRITNLQRSVSAAEAKTTVVQKEFISAIGVVPQAFPVGASTEKPNDKRVRDLEDRIALVEAEGRKKAREDSYKIAELEYRLLESHEALAKTKSVAEKSPLQPPPPPPDFPPPGTETTKQNP